ncbi:hypothetical protein [Pedobacter foliorum]|uniref:hypothetical protein n=1 Tax=Pedobacter foliorum TaxID=2739058 RepID=UPI0015645C3C|nr:hypothetical protein [Pedobacter foliorum]NRF40977.1 hypothetical protein [Pedobacter foliorum]
MKVKLTPLNIVSAICLVIAVLLLINKKEEGNPKYVDITGILVGFSFLTAIVAFISDQIFRRFILNLKKLWVVEGMLVIFITILIFIIKASIS